MIPVVFPLVQLGADVCRLLLFPESWTRVHVRTAMNICLGDIRADGLTPWCFPVYLSGGMTALFLVILSCCSSVTFDPVQLEERVKP